MVSARCEVVNDVVITAPISDKMHLREGKGEGRGIRLVACRGWPGARVSKYHCKEIIGTMHTLYPVPVQHSKDSHFETKQFAVQSLKLLVGTVLE